MKELHFTNVAELVQTAARLTLNGDKVINAFEIAGGYYLQFIEKEEKVVEIKVDSPVEEVKVAEEKPKRGTPRKKVD